MEIVSQRTRDFFKINDSYKTTKLMCLVVLIVIVVAYNRVFTDIIANPDGLTEGFYYYTNADWASAGCGRWLIRYYNLIHCNVISPVLVLFEYMLFGLLTSIVVVKVLNIKNKLSIILTTIILSLTPTVISHLSYTCTAAPYALSCLFASLFVYFILKEEKYNIVLATICLTLSMGCYQSYIGFAASLTLMVVVEKTLNNEEINKILRIIVKSLIAALFAGALYYLIYQLDLKIYGLTAIERAANFSFTDIIKFFPIKFVEMYKVYFTNFVDNVLKHKIIYMIVSLISLMIILLGLLKLIKEKDIKRIIIYVAAVLLIPCASNIIGVIVPTNGVTLLMCQQGWLIFPFIYSIVESTSKTLLLKYTVSFLVILLSLTYTIQANATFACYELSYKYNNSQMQSVLDKIYDLEGYTKDETKIVMVGFPNESVLRNNNQIYRYGINLHSNLVFWEDLYGSTRCRETYFMNMFGIDAREVDYDEYYYVITSSKFEKMPCWPKKGSVDMIGGYAVVKFTNEPLYPY